MLNDLKTDLVQSEVENDASARRLRKPEVNPKASHCARSCCAQADCGVKMTNDADEASGGKDGIQRQ